MHNLALCPQGFTTRRQDADARCAFEQVLSEDSGSFNNSLATIQDDQHPLTAQECSQPAGGVVYRNLESECRS